MKKFLSPLAIILFAISSFAQSFDGPAKLPAPPMETRMSFTPSSNYPKYVGPTGSLLATWQSAVPGDTILVDPAITLTLTSNLALPNGNCSTGQWITIRTASNMIPDEFTRINSSYYQYMPKIIIASQSASITGGSCTRLIGIDVGASPNSPIVYNLFKGLGTNIIIDRSHIHGTPTTEVNRGVSLSDSHNVAVIHSVFDEFHCRSVSGACTDSQAIAGGTDAVGGGNYFIFENTLSAAGQEILFGGGASVDVPSNIVIKRNYLYKPTRWNPSSPDFDGGTAGSNGIKHPWLVKNHIEFKNADSVLVEGNVYENVWGGFSQVGAANLVTAKNQAGPNGTNICPVCAVTNVTIRLNSISYEAQGFQIACAASDNGGLPAACGNYSIHYNAVAHLGYPTCYNCSSFTNQLGLGSTVIMQHVLFSHNSFQNDTILAPPADPAASTASAVLLVSAIPPAVGSAGYDIHFDYNLYDPGNYGIYNSGPIAPGGIANCFSGTYPPMAIKSKIALCWGSNSSFVGNQINPTIKWAGYLPWPDGNFVAPSVAPSAGANMTAVNAATAGVKQ